MVGHCDQVLQLEAVHPVLERFHQVGPHLELGHLILERLEAFGQRGVVDRGLLLVGAAEIHPEEREDHEAEEEADEEGTLAGFVVVSVHSVKPLKGTHKSPPGLPGRQRVCFWFGKEQKGGRMSCSQFLSQKTCKHSINKPFCQAKLCKERF